MNTDLIKLAEDFFQTKEILSQLLKGDGSDREIYRIHTENTPPKTVIGIYHKDLEENRQFLLITETMKKRGLPVPQVFAQDSRGTAYLLEDLGDSNLAEAINSWTQAGEQERIVPAYKKVLDYLPRIQTELPPILPHLKGQVLDKKAHQIDLEYFRLNFLERYDFLPLFKGQVIQELEQTLLGTLSVLPPKYFVYRDFQSRNIMWLKDSPVFIDYQSAMMGPLYYDPASMLYASKAALNDKQRQELLQHYYDILPESLSYEEFENNFYLFVLIRRLRSLGSYGYLSGEKGKSYFFKEITPTLNQMVDLLANKPALNNFPHLLSMFQTIREKWKG